MGLWNSLNGMIQVELTSADIGQALQSVNERGIALYHLEHRGELTARFFILRKSYSGLRELCEKRGETLQILRKKGLFWTAAGMIKRPVLMVGLILTLLAVSILPTRILFIRVEGNTAIAENKILEAAERCGILFGASRKMVRSEKAKNALLSEIPELQWVGVNTYGCVAVISVREREPESTQDDSIGVSNIVAARDGIVTDITVTRGNGLCVQGQAVSEGQVLISGYTDCGLCIVAARAEGEIFARTDRKMEVVTPAGYFLRGEITDVKKKISICFGKKRINLWKDSGIWDSSCGRMYEEYCITLPGGFSLPMTLAVETYFCREVSEAVLTEEEAFPALSGFAQQYLKEQMVAGSVLQKEEKCTLQNEVYTLKGSYVCTEMIGREQQEKIGEHYGKDD